jgi:hypothetical protein
VQEQNGLTARVAVLDDVEVEVSGARELDSHPLAQEGKLGLD